MSQAAVDKQWFGHPRGLSTLFFTELWERLSYYGMRAILVLFMVDQLENGGGGLTDGKAAAIYGLYTAGVYLLALPGGWIADRILGQQRAVFWGGCVIAAGHFTMALPIIPGLADPQGGLVGLSAVSFYGGLILIVIGTGLLKPNVSAIVGDLYPEKGARRDAGFSVFYMGINIGAFAGPLICGWLGEEVDWHLGFSAAGFGMVLGLIQYRFGLKYLGDSGKASQEPKAVAMRPMAWVYLWSAINSLAIAGILLYVLRELLGLTLETVAQAMGVVIVVLAIVYFSSVLFLGGLTSREKKRVLVIFFLFVGAALFWSGFEQAGSSMNLFAERHTDLGGPLVPLFLGLPVLGMLFFVIRLMNGPGVRLLMIRLMPLCVVVILGAVALGWLDLVGFLSPLSLSLAGAVALGLLALVCPPDLYRKIVMALLCAAAIALLVWAVGPGRSFNSPASWLQSVNPLFIIVLAPIFGWLWVAMASREPSIPFKFGAGLVLLGLGFLVLSWGSTYISESASGVTPMWLIFTYFLHTAGELCLSPVGLSSVTKLSPHRLVGQMMGTWFMGAALGNLIAGLVAGRIETMPLPNLFGTVAIFVIVAGGLFLVFTIPIKKLIGDLHQDDDHETQVPLEALDEAPPPGS